MNESLQQKKDIRTAQAFATSWNNLPGGSVYTSEQFTDWMSPLSPAHFKQKRVLELGCGNASLLTHVTRWMPASITGVDLGDSVVSAENNMKATGYSGYQIVKSDLTEYRSRDKFDIVYCIGVIHHLKEPYKGFESVIANTAGGGNFHCWVYAREGNALIRYVVDPIRKVASSFPWWVTKYLVATPLAFLYFLYAHLITRLHISFLPLYEYSQWICKRNFMFFRHVAFDQLVTPQTVYIDKKTIEKWLSETPGIDRTSTYIIFRNGNSWKFVGKTIL